MYTYYTKNKDKVIAQKIDMNYDIFDNVSNIELILKQYNNIQSVINRKKWLLLEDSNNKIVYFKKMYLELKEDLEIKKLNRYKDNSTKVFNKKVTSNVIKNYDFIKDLDNKLNLIDYYFEICDSILNHKELNISFNNKENQSKKLKFINLCLINIDNPENFIKSLIEKDNLYSINKQKKLKYKK